MNIGFLTFASVTNWDQALQIEDQALQTHRQALQPPEAPRTNRQAPERFQTAISKVWGPPKKDLSLGVSECPNRAKRRQKSWSNLVEFSRIYSNRQPPATAVGRLRTDRIVRTSQSCPQKCRDFKMSMSSPGV